MASGDDGNSSLSAIARQQGSPIVSLLVDIQSNPATTQSRVLSFLENLQCLRLPRLPEGQRAADIRVNRERINAFHFHRYVALSYTWTASEHEDETPGLYSIQERDGRGFEPSEVRNCILNRIFNYMRTINVNLLWIDQHSIMQGTDGCKRPTCTHGACIQKREGMEVMDLVYKFSEHPVGLLGRPITSKLELKLLANLLQRKLTSGTGAHVRLSRKRNPQEAWMALKMLQRITKDDWWHRGWIFQENYKGGTRMKLLIKHSETLEGLKRSYRNKRSHYGRPIFGYADGELCIYSVDFMEEATRLCLACRKSNVRHRIPSNPRMREREMVMEQILQTAGKYRLVLKPSESMTPRIIADIEKRKMKERWDRLAITANCCQYSTRLNVLQLMQDNASLSLAMLALCLLNGEVLHNGYPPHPRASGKTVSEMTVSEFLKESVFDGFNSPSHHHSLTFNRRCRFFDVTLTNYGIKTRGHMWKIYKIIDTCAWPPQGAWVEDLTGMLEPIQRKQLAYFACHLAIEGHARLSHEIKAYLENDSRLARIPHGNLSFTERYMHMMASEVADAIARGSPLGLGCLWTPDEGHRHSPYKAVFVLDNGGTPSQTSDMSDESDESDDGEVFAFTASCPEDKSSEEYDSNDLDRHVSFEVEVEGLVGDTDGLIPKLRIRRWLSGLCFFKTVPRSYVVFSWPRDLELISP